MKTYSPAPVRFVYGRGTELFDDAGSPYLDFLAGIAVVSLGHCQPAWSRRRSSQQAERGSARVEPVRQRAATSR